MSAGELSSTQQQGRWTVWQFAWLIGLAGASSALTIFTVVWAARRLGLSGARPEILLPLLLVGGLIALVTSLMILVAAFRLFGLTNTTKPFGVPEGTLQAIIALSLILIFAISSLYLRGTFTPQSATLSDLTSKEAAQIPINQILERRIVSQNPLRYEVQRQLPIDQDAKDFSNQLLTILGTLVGAVAGFYFGAKSVETGVTAGGTTVKPTNTSPPSVSGSPLVGETLRAQVGGWTGSPPPNYGHQWQCMAGDGGWRDIGGANAPNYTLAVDDRGKMMRVLVTATNAAGASSIASKPVGPVRCGPINKKPPEITGEAKVGETLTAASDAEQDWIAWPLPTLSYQWQRKVLGDSWTAIETANAESYKVRADDRSAMLRAVVTASNNVKDASVPSNPTEPVPE